MIEPCMCTGNCVYTIMYIQHRPSLYMYAVITDSGDANSL